MCCDCNTARALALHVTLENLCIQGSLAGQQSDKPAIKKQKTAGTKHTNLEPTMGSQGDYITHVLLCFDPKQVDSLLMALAMQAKARSLMKG